MTEIRRNRVRTRIDDSSMPGRALHRPPAAPGALTLPALSPTSITLADVTAPPDPADPALQVLTMAQRTADEHLLAAGQAAESIRSEAEAAAEQIRRDAETRREEIRAEADQLLAEAREAAEQELSEARSKAEVLQQEARETLSRARAEAEQTDSAARAAAEKLRRSAQFRHDHVVGGLEATRESYQRQIEALAEFDHEYRARLSTFMQSQLRELWTDKPHVDDKRLTGPVKIVPRLDRAA